MTDWLMADGVGFGEYINADAIEKSQTGRDRRTRSLRAQAVATDRRTRCMAERRDFSFETVMSHPSKVELLRTARALGFEAVVFFVATASPDINVRRVRERVAAGGHDVEERAIRERYKRTLSHLYGAVRAADRSVVFDNTGESATGGPGRPLRPVAEVHSDGTRAAIVRRASDLPEWTLAALIGPIEADLALLDAEA